MTSKLSILFVAFTMIGCKKPPSSETIEADHELKIVRNGKTLLAALPYGSAQGDGNQIKVYLPGGEWVQVDVDASGDSPSIYIQRTKTDGSPVFFELQPSGKAINRSEHPLGTLPEDDGFKPNTTAEPSRAIQRR